MNLDEGKQPIANNPIERKFKNIKFALDKSAIVAATDCKGTITYVNEKFCEISKYSKEELVGQNHRIINSGYHPRSFFVNLWKTIAAGQIWQGEIRNRAKDGSIYWVSTTIVPFLDEAGVPEEYISIRFDITNRKTIEERLRRESRRLEESNRELNSFASVAAHDLQEPLRKIQAFSDRLQAAEKQNLTDKGKSFLTRMQEAAKRMQMLINDLLTYSRVMTKAEPPKPTDLNAVIKDVVSDLEVRIEQTKGRVDVEVLPTLEADSTQMRQLFQNLIANALKFHKRNTAPVIRISAQNAEPSELEVFPELKGRDFLKISVEDNGIGFEEKYLDRIFTIFQRLHDRDAFEGTGLGLAVCRRIVERHGGTITAKSKPDEGATFSIFLPSKHKRHEEML